MIFTAAGWSLELLIALDRIEIGEQGPKGDKGETLLIALDRIEMAEPFRHHTPISLLIALDRIEMT